MSDWDSYERAADKGPWQIGVKGILLVAGFTALTMLIGIPFGWFSETAAVAKREFGAKAAIEKYEWFKDASAQLSKKQADIAVYEQRIKALQETYANLPRQQWPREDREQMNVWTSEVAGVRASYNSLAAEYNAAASKFNWQSFNSSLPQEFRPYEN
jgi:hypothetical protein